MTVPKIELKAGQGIASVTSGNTGTNILFPGDSDSKLEIQAVLKDKYQFAAWSGEGAIRFNGNLYVGKLYDKGLSFEDGGLVYYFTDKTCEDDIYIPGKLSAIAEKVEILQDADTANSRYIRSLENYNYGYTIYQYGENIEKLTSESEAFRSQFGMQLEYYYTLQCFQVAVNQFVLGGNGSITILGEDSYPHGSNAILSAGYPAGYTFLGWFETAQLPANPTVDTLPVAVSAETIFTIPVTGACDYTAVILANDVDIPALEVSGIQSLTYGYSSSADLVVTVKANLEANADPASYIRGYQWYLDGKIIDKATGASYSIPEGWNAGDHDLTCEVTVARKDNGVSAVVSAYHTVTVNQVSIYRYVYSNDHTAVYDGTDNHSISLDIATLEDSKDCRRGQCHNEKCRHCVYGTSRNIPPGNRELYRCDLRCD